jgi:membrane protein DedA with SNARE-associated domain/predicted ABC-type transport system involved in lysophospholipase L1 biosynthesis ATPase subunit
MLELVMSVPLWLTYLMVGLLGFGESAAFVGLVLPGETALLVGGVMAGTGRLSLPIVVAVAVVAAIAGDSVGYEIGRHGGPAIKSSRAGRFVGEQRWAKGEAFTRRHGNWAVLVGRWVGLMRALVPALAGMTGMPYRRFLLFNAIGGAVWASAVVLGGYFAGASWQRLQSVLGNITYVGIGAAAIGALTVLVVRHAKKCRALTHRYARKLVATAALMVILAAGVGQVAVYRWTPPAANNLPPGAATRPLRAAPVPSEVLIGHSLHRHGLRGVSLTVHRGESVGLLGGAGAGNTALLALLTRIDEPDSGFVHVAGHKLNLRTGAERARLRAEHIGILYAYGNPLDHMTVAQNIVLARHLAGQPGHRDVAGRLAVARLDERSDVFPAELSPVERSRAALVVALASDPPLLVADEPTVQLDETTQQPSCQR